MQSYYPPDGLFPRRRTSSATSPPASRHLHEQPSAHILIAPNDQPSPSPAFTGDIHDSPQSQTSSNASELPNTLHPLPRSAPGVAFGHAGAGEVVASASVIQRMGKGSSGDPLTHQAAVVSPTSPHPRVLASQQYTPDTPASASERDFPTVSQHSRAPLIAKDYEYDHNSPETPGAKYSPASSPRTGTRLSRAQGDIMNGRYAYDADDAENADMDDRDRYSPASTSGHSRPGLVSSYTDRPISNMPGRDEGAYPYQHRDADHYHRRDRSSTEEDLPLPPEGPQDAYVAQHITPLAPLPSQSQTRKQSVDAQDRAAGSRNANHDAKPTVTTAKGLGQVPDSPPAPSPVFVRHNTAPGLPQPSATQPLSPGLDSTASGVGHDPFRNGTGGAGDATGGHNSTTAQDDPLPIFHVLDAHLDTFSAKTVDKLKQHLDAVARMQDEVCAMHLELEGLAPLGEMRVGGVHGDGVQDGHAGLGSGSTADDHGGKGQRARKGLFSSKSHGPNVPSHTGGDDAGTANQAEAKAKAKAGSKAKAEAEAANLIATRERGVEAIMNKLGALSDQIRAYHHLGTPKLAFRHPGTGAGSAPVSAYPASVQRQNLVKGDADEAYTHGDARAFDAVSPVLASGGGLGAYRRASTAADASDNSILRPSPIIVPPSANAPTTTTFHAGAAAARSSPTSPTSPEWHTRRLAALHAFDRDKDRPLSNAHTHAHAMSDAGRHKPKHPSHLDQVFTARRDSAYTGTELATEDGTTDPSASRGTTVGINDGRKSDGALSPGTPHHGGSGDGGVSPKSTTADRFFSGFGTGKGGGVRRQSSAQGLMRAPGEGRDVKGDQSWIESR